MKIYIIHKGEDIFDQTTDPLYAANLLLDAGRGYHIKSQDVR